MRLAPGCPVSPGDEVRPTAETFAVRNTRKSAAWVAVHERDRSSVVTRHCPGLVQQVLLVSQVQLVLQEQLVKLVQLVLQVLQALPVQQEQQEQLGILVQQVQLE